MATTARSQDGTITTTSYVDVASSPSSGNQHLIKSIVLHNTDAGSVTVTLQYKHASDERTLAPFTLAAGGTYVWDVGQVLDDTDKSLRAKLGSTPTGPTSFVTTYLEVSP